MSFEKTISEFGTVEFDKCLREETHVYISCLNIKALTRCGGHAAEPELVSILKTTTSDKTLSITVVLQFNDGYAHDCSGHCGGSVVQRRDTLVVTIDRKTGNAHWSTADGVITSDS